MDIFQKLPMAKRSAMELLFQNCTEKVKNYMFTMDVAAGQTFIQAGEPCINIVIILSGRASGVEWPMHGHSYPFKDFGPGDFLGEIESLAGMRQYRVSVVALTDCRVLAIPVFCYMGWKRAADAVSDPKIRAAWARGQHLQPETDPQPDGRGNRIFH